MQLQLQNLCRQYGTKCAVNHVNANLSPGVYGLLGANGAGKTTLMRMICGVLKPTSGSIRLDRTELARLDENALAEIRNRKLGFVFQDFLLLDGLTVRQNILLPRITSILLMAALSMTSHIRMMESRLSCWVLAHTASEARWNLTGAQSMLFRQFASRATGES